MKKIHAIIITLGIIFVGAGIGGVLYYQFSDQPSYLESKFLGDEFNQEFWTKENVARYYASNRGHMSSRGHMGNRGHMSSRGHMGNRGHMSGRGYINGRWNDDYRYEGALSYEEVYQEAVDYLNQYEGLTLAEDYVEINGFYIFQVVQGDEVQGLLSVDAYTKDIMEY